MDNNLIKNIVPTILKNGESNKFDTKDLIYIDDYTDKYYKGIRESVLVPSYTDYAELNNVHIPAKLYRSLAGRNITQSIYRIINDEMEPGYITEHGEAMTLRNSVANMDMGICPALHYYIFPNPNKDTIIDNIINIFKSKKEEKIENFPNFDIKEVKDKNGKIIYHTLQLGEYPKTIVNQDISRLLEGEYNNGKLKGDIKATGRWFSANGQTRKYLKYNGRHNPEFEYNGKKYVRVALNPFISGLHEKPEKNEKNIIKWLTVEPISFIIKNWDEMPKEINPNGNGRAQYFDLKSEEAIISNIPFHSSMLEEYNELWQNSSIRGFLNGINVENIIENGNPEYSAKSGGNYEGETNFLNEAFNLERNQMIEYEVPLSEDEIPFNAFNGCVTLKKLKIHPNIKEIGKGAFDGIDFKYACYTRKDEIEFLKDEPEEKEKYTQIINLEKIRNTLRDFDDYDLLLKKDKVPDLLELTELLNKTKFRIPFVYGLILLENYAVKKFSKESDFRYFKSEFPDIDKELSKYSIEEQANFFKFAKAIGCFSKEKVLDKDNKETKTVLGQKASSILARIIKSNAIPFGMYSKLFSQLSVNAKPNQDFIKFIDICENKDRIKNLNMLINLEKEYPRVFIKAMTKFDSVEALRTSIGEDGKPIKVPWETAFKRLYIKDSYKGITDENEDIAALYLSKALPEYVFREASNLRSEAQVNKVPEHILGKPLREETMIEIINKVRNETGQELVKAQETLGKLYERQFTYEWLSKKDPHNAIMGIYCSCCSIITGSLYGKSIAVSSIVDPNIQNIIVRNSKGEMISKGTMYLNKQEGYGVINEFELNEKYKNHDKNEDNSIEEEQRNLIFEAFKRGIGDFVKEYDQQNQSNPIKQINVGMGYNKLKKQVQQFEKDTSNLSVPVDYKFEDAKFDQYILYKRKGREKEKEEEQER